VFIPQSVVSASCEPDNFVVSRLSDNEIIGRAIASKKSKVVENEDGYTTEVDISDEDASRASLTDDQAKWIARVAVSLEKELFDGISPADVEFALSQDGKLLYLLQVRGKIYRHFV